MKALFKQIFFLGRCHSFVGLLSCKRSKRGEGGWKWVLGRTEIHLHWAGWLGPQSFWTASMHPENLDSFFPNLSQNSWNTIFLVNRKEERKEGERKQDIKKKKIPHTFLYGFRRSKLAKWLQFPHSRWDLLSHHSGTLPSGTVLWRRQKRPFSFRLNKGGCSRNAFPQGCDFMSDLRMRTYKLWPWKTVLWALSQSWGSRCKGDYLLRRRSERVKSHRCC